ncbi:unnamed protein product, partial [Laminaria digitata]
MAFTVCLVIVLCVCSNKTLGAQFGHEVTYLAVWSRAELLWHSPMKTRVKVVAAWLKACSVPEAATLLNGTRNVKGVGYATNITSCGGLAFLWSKSCKVMNT